MESRMEAMQTDDNDGCCSFCFRTKFESTQKASFGANLDGNVDRKVAILTGTCFLCCIVTVGACISTLVLFYQIQTLRNDVLRQVPKVSSDDPWSSWPIPEVGPNVAVNPDSTEQAPEVQFLQGEKLQRQQRSQRERNPVTTRKPAKRRRKGKHRGKQGKCPKRLKRCLRQKRHAPVPSTAVTMPTTSTTSLHPTIHPTIQQFVPQHITPLAAAHYGSYMDSDFVTSEFGVLDHGNLTNAVYCKAVDGWRGTACRNKTFSSTEIDIKWDGIVNPVAPLLLNVFREATWMNSSAVTTLFDKQPNGVFVARVTGMYLLYAHAQFYNKDRQGLAILHETDTGYEAKNILRCQDGSSETWHRPRAHHRNHYACSVTGSIYIQARETIKVLLLDNGIWMDLREDQSYFGAFLLLNFDSLNTGRHN